MRTLHQLMKPGAKAQKSLGFKEKLGLGARKPTKPALPGSPPAPSPALPHDF